MCISVDRRQESEFLSQITYYRLKPVAILCVVRHNALYAGVFVYLGDVICREGVRNASVGAFLCTKLKIFMNRSNRQSAAVGYVVT